MEKFISTFQLFRRLSVILSEKTNNHFPPTPYHRPGGRGSANLEAFICTKQLREGERESEKRTLDENYRSLLHFKPTSGYLLPQSPSKEASFCNLSSHSLTPLLPAASGPPIPSSSPPGLEGRLWVFSPSQAGGDQGTPPGQAAAELGSLLRWRSRAWDCPGCGRISA